jgi:hypothetical protein
MVLAQDRRMFGYQGNAANFFLARMENVVACTQAGICCKLAI